MKSSILTTILALTALGAFAMTPTRADDEALVFGYCGDYAASLGTSNKDITTEYAAIEIPEDLAQSWKGAYLTKVNVGYGLSSVKDITLFVSESLDGTPYYTQTATMTTQGGWNMVELDTPLEISGKAFFVGYSTKVNSTNDKPIGVDNLKDADSPGAWVNTYDEWENVGRYYGNVCIRLSLIGDNLPQYNVQASGLSIPPVVAVDEPFSVDFTVENNGLKTINNIEVSCSINGAVVPDVTVSLTAPIVSGSSAQVTANGLVCIEEGESQPLEITITKVNGNPNEAETDNKVSGNVNCALKTFKKNVIIEEFTGTWCGYCPLGIVGMAYMKEKYGKDGFIGVAVHNGDPLQVESYAELADNITGGNYPSAILDRKVFFLSPSASYMEELYLEAAKYPASAGLNVRAAYSLTDKTLLVTSISQFSFAKTDASYALAFGIIEDHMGPYPQKNYFSGGAYGYLEGWSNNTSEVPTYYNEVGRVIKDTYGIEGSLPSNIEANKLYEYVTDLPLDAVEDINRCEVIAMLLDTSTGRVVNSAKASISKHTADVETIGEEESEITVYSPQGILVLKTNDKSQLERLPKGIYIINGKKYKL